MLKAELKVQVEWNTGSNAKGNNPKKGSKRAHKNERSGKYNNLAKRREQTRQQKKVVFIAVQMSTAKKICLNMQIRCNVYPETGTQAS
jgi:hypothetical protein